MNINETKAWILGRGARKDRYGLDKMYYILEELDAPHLDYCCVVVGGTNGKGSVTAIAESILKECDDYNIGTLTSPHLIDMRERIRIQGEKLPDKYWINGVKELKQIYKVMDKEPSLGSPSFFETISALAFWSFRETERDLVIMEVGLGGRFDATNSCDPEISVVTNIGTDHEEFLGKGKPNIAREKLGIIRKKRPLITSEKDPGILKIFTEKCKAKKSPLVLAKDCEYFSVINSNSDGHLIKLPFSENEVFLSLPGQHQLSNLSLALELIMQLRKHGFQIPDEAIEKGIAEVKWPGRLQWVESNPPVLLDGAHNPEGLETLVNYLETFPPERPVNILFGTLKDKPMLDMADRLAKFGKKLCFVPPTSNRAFKREDFDAAFADRKNKSWVWYDDFIKAFEECRKDSNSIIVTGSLYLISEALKYLDENV
ncbi:MAG: bifunctional folylpolyglutamate synthase/dihydrofolate synthase [Candidatus Rifleibacteriota bacterium]